MCFINDGQCEFYDTINHKARKQHRCDECRKTIEVGDVYVYASGKFDGQFFSVKTCRLCDWKRKLIAKQEMARGCDYYESWVPHGELAEAVANGDYDLFMPPMLIENL